MVKATWKDTHDWGEWNVTKIATCTETGFQYRVCKTNKWHKEVQTIDAKGHNLTRVEAVAATYTEAGNSEYWYCEVCGEYFSDAEGTKPIADKTSVVIPRKSAVASITKGEDTAYYGTLAEAIAAAEAGDTVVLLADVRSVGVQGDGRTYGHPVVLRPVTSEDAMTADWTRVPYDALETISTRITNEVAEVNRVVLDVTSKPPGTIEWE